MIDESVFNQLIDETLLSIEEAIDDSGLDIDYDNVAGILTLEFNNQTKVIINRQTALRQLWIAAKSGGFHLDYADNQWFCRLEKCDLLALLNRVCTEQALTKVELVLN